MEYRILLESTANFLAKEYPTIITNPERQDTAIRIIENYLQKYDDEDDRINGEPIHKVAVDLYRDLASFGILSIYLNNPDLEEININSWDDICLAYVNGDMKKAAHFETPEQAENIIRKLLRESNVTIDGGTPLQRGHLGNNIRITAMKSPLMDDDVRVSASIRILHTDGLPMRKLHEYGMFHQEMADFICDAIRYGSSLIFVGGTNSGKTTLMNAALSTIPENRRIFTIETGARELFLRRKDKDGHYTNNVVHTLSRPSEIPSQDIKQEDLVIAALRYNPDVICVGEILDQEAFDCVEAALTDHVVVSSVHASFAGAAHERIGLLCQRKHPIDFNITMMQVGQAFPIVVHCKRMEDHRRRVMDISECVVDAHGKRTYHSLYRYEVLENIIENGECVIKGQFRKTGIISDRMRERFIINGMPAKLIEKYTGKGDLS